MHITFLDRKHGRHIDATFTLYDGPTPIDPLWMIDDTVSLLFEISMEQEKAIRQHEPHGVEVYGGMHPINNTSMVHIPCRVVGRRHSASWREVGKFTTLGTSVSLEATTGEWEDVLIWIITGKKPNWK